MTRGKGENAMGVLLDALEAQERLYLHASLLLWKFSVGREDWGEWVELRDYLYRIATKFLDSQDPTRLKIEERIKDFDERLVAFTKDRPE